MACVPCTKGNGMTTAGSYTETFVEVADVRLQFRQGGTGEPLLVLHGELGVPGWLQVYELLAEHFMVYVPSLPGFGQSASPDWIISVRDLAAWVSWFVRDLRLPQSLNVIGCSMGGWIAAEIATVNAALFKRMVLVGAAGLKPEVGEVWDYFVHAPREAFPQSLYAPEHVPEYVSTMKKPGHPRKISRLRATGRWPAVCSGSRTCAATRSPRCCAGLPRQHC